MENVPGVKAVMRAAVFVVLLVFGGMTAVAADATSPRPLAGRSAAATEETVSGPFEEAPAEGEYIADHYIVVLKGTVSEVGNVARSQVERHDGKLGFVYRHALRGYSAELSPQDVKELRQNPKVKYIAPDLKVQAEGEAVPTGIVRSGAYGNANLKINGEEDFSVNADVAVIDTGIDYTHPDLNVVARTNCVPSGENLETEGLIGSCTTNSGTDLAGHGTHVAGIIGAKDNNFGVVGMAPGVRLWAVRVLNKNGIGSTAWILAGIDYVTEHASEIEVANMSLGSEGHSVPQEEAISRSIAAGVVYVVAAGNQAENEVKHNPANDPEVISVAALSDYDGFPGEKATSACNTFGLDDSLANYSNWGPGVDIAAPGSCIYSTWKEGGYAIDSGTSMASPHVAGAAAILASKSNPNSKAAVEEIRNQLVAEGQLNWNDASEDSTVEPLLYAGGTPLTGVEAATAGYSSTDGNTVTVFGTINTHGAEASYQFEYGPTTSYGSKTSLQSVPGKALVNVNAALAGLPVEQTYHYRLVVTSGGTTVYGKDHPAVRSAATMELPNKGKSAPGEWLAEISCASPTYCVAVGNYEEGEEHKASARRLVEGKWQIAALPAPASGESEVYANGVSCVSSSTWCTVVGESRSPNGTWRAYTAHWNGSGWVTNQPPVVPASDRTYLEAVSCWAEGECMAVGSFLDISLNEWRTYAVRLASGSWTQVTTPNPYQSVSRLHHLRAVSCLSASFCEAGGATLVVEGAGHECSQCNHPMLLKWDGSKWIEQSAGYNFQERTGISCVSTTFCVTTGQTPKDAETWNGSEWRNYGSPEFEGLSRRWIGDISCSSENYCLATGLLARGRRESSLLALWQNHEWRLLSPARSADVEDVLDYTPEGSGVSCTYSAASGVLCRAAGVGYGEKEEPLIETRHLGAPGIKPEAATGVKAREATINASIEPGIGGVTKYRVEYGTTTAYGLSAPAKEGESNGQASAFGVSVPLANLKAETTYHYRFVATGPEGTATSADQQFTTTAVPVDWQHAGNSVLAGNYTEAVVGTGSAFTISSTLLGIPIEVQCSSATTSGSIVGGGTGSSSIGLSGCTVSQPSHCSLASQPTLNANVELVQAGGVLFQKFVPSGTEFAKVKFAGAECALNEASGPLKGSFAGRELSSALAANHSLSFTKSEPWPSVQLTLGTKAATLGGEVTQHLSGAIANHGWRALWQETHGGWEVESGSLFASPESAVVSGGPVKFSYTIGGSPVSFSCSETSAKEASLKPGGTETVNGLKFSGCKVEQPTSACSLPGNEMQLAAVTGTLTRVNSKVYEKFAASVSGETLTTIRFEGGSCPIAGTNYAVKGTFAALGTEFGLFKVTQPLEFSKAANEATGAQLTIGGTVGVTMAGSVNQSLLNATPWGAYGF